MSVRRSLRRKPPSSTASQSQPPVIRPASKAASARKTTTASAPPSPIPCASSPAPAPVPPSPMETSDVPGGPHTSLADLEDDICLHGLGEEDDDVSVLLADSPRVDLYFVTRGEEGEEAQWTALYKAALKFSTALPPGRQLDEEEVEEFIAGCPMALTGPGGPGEWDDEDEGEEGEEGEEGGGTVGLGQQPFSLMFPSARRVADFLAWVVHVGPAVVWGQDEEGTEGGEETKVRLYWRMDLSDFIPLVA